MDQQLVVDVGMHRGEDVDAYLAAGYRVLAVEANPDLVREVSDRLADEISAGRLRIVHAAVTDSPGDVTFYAGGETGWGSLTDSRAGAALDVETYALTVPGDTLDRIVGDETPHYVKVDIEGADAAAIRSLERFPVLPAFVSWECDLLAVDETSSLLNLLERLGYRRFKLVNQALHHDGNTSGPFGDAAPGDWLDAQAIWARYLEVAHQQRARAAFAETGRIFGLPLGRFYRILHWAYNVAPVGWARTRWASARGAELGGWFDIHAGR